MIWVNQSISCFAYLVIRKIDILIRFKSENQNLADMNSPHLFDVGILPIFTRLTLHLCNSKTHHTIIDVTSNKAKHFYAIF